MAECLLFSRSFALSGIVRYVLTHLLFIVLGGYVFLVPSVQAVSFDCAHARMKVEKLICDDPQLSKLDEELAESYAKALEQAADPRLVKVQQREWLTNVRKRCRDIACLRNTYALRIASLAEVKQAEADLAAQSIRSDIETCKSVAEHANRGDLQSILVMPTSRDSKELKHLFGKDVELYEYPSYWFVDLDNDGVREHFVLAVHRDDEGTGERYGYARSSRKGSTVVEFNDNADRNIYLSVLSVKGRYYILSATPPSLGRLWRLANGEFVTMCKFTQHNEPMIERIGEKENPVCREANEHRIPPVAFSGTHEISAVLQEQLQKQKRWLYLEHDLARVDINNDGLLDNVIRFRAFGPHGCDANYLATIDETRTQIPDTALNDLLYHDLGRDHCSRSLEIVVHEGVTYVGMLSWAPQYTVYRIKGSTVDMVCEFPGRVINEVVDTGLESGK